MNKKVTIRNIHLIIIIIGIIFVTLSIFHTNIWFDEAYSVGMANHNFIDIWKIGGHDVHPVLYYWMLRIVCLISNGSILAYRIFSALGVVLMGILGYTHIRKDFGEKTGILFSFLCYFLPMMAVYANQIRMYSWAILIVTILSIYSYRIYIGETNKKNWIIFGLSSLASIFIHYYGLMAAGLINLFLLIHFIKSKKYKELKLIIGIGIIQIIAYMPWILYLFKQIQHVSKGFWIEFTFPNTLFELIGCQMNGIKNDTCALAIGFGINVLLFIYLGVVLVKNRKKVNFQPAKFAILIYISVIIAAIIITKVLKKPILYYRYLFVITGLYIFSVSYILSKSNNLHIVLIWCAIIICFGTINNIIQIKENYAKGSGEQIQYLKNNILEDDVIVYKNIGNGSIFASHFLNNEQYFYNPENWGVEEAYLNWAPQMKTYITTDFLQYCTGRVWIIDSQDNEFYNELFNNDSFKKISTEYFKQEYQNYIYNITLVERIK